MLEEVGERLSHLNQYIAVLPDVTEVAMLGHVVTQIGHGYGTEHDSRLNEAYQK